MTDFYRLPKGGVLPKSIAFLMTPIERIYERERRGLTAVFDVLVDFLVGEVGVVKAEEFE